MFTPRVSNSNLRNFKEFATERKKTVKYGLETVSFSCSQLQTLVPDTAQKMKFSIKDFFSKCDQICGNLGIWSHLLKKSLMENFIFCAVKFFPYVLIQYQLRKSIFNASTLSFENISKQQQCDISPGGSLTVLLVIYPILAIPYASGLY